MAIFEGNNLQIKKPQCWWLVEKYAIASQREKLTK